ncbi:unnamed protein product [Adineta ricciae]|uniref:Peptidase S1 domain-containing protein n=1 Tax=Adineta ricciae TaxID=249248 RepID=A0A814HT61_ADIRI|nr:unnamed protein product [Adineta ricciae]CAF1166234.1 unnamed protein product [Adineta ricciae]
MTSIPLSSGNCSWTIWFNNGKPYNASSGDFEDTAEIIANNPEAMCKTPIAMEVQTINYQNGDWNYEWQAVRTTDNISLVSFYAVEPAGVDFRVRYCCPGHVLTSTMHVMTTDSSTFQSSSTYGVQEISSSTNDTIGNFRAIEARENAWPWIAYLHKSKVDLNETCFAGCSAIIIDKDHLITSAHCVKSMDPTNISLIAGLHRLSSRSEEDRRQLRSIKQIFLHPQYNSLTNVNDVAVLRLQTSFALTKYVQSICFSDGTNQLNEKVIAVGWSRQQLDGVRYKALKQIYATVVHDCKSHWSSYDHNLQLCISNPINSSSICQNFDHGVIFTRHDGRYTFEGVSSYAGSCDSIGKTYESLVFTRISAFKTWIHQIVQQ